MIFGMEVGVRAIPLKRQNAYMHEETTIGFSVRTWGRKYLNECTPFSGVRQCCDSKHIVTAKRVY